MQLNHTVTSAVKSYECL